MNPGAPTPRPRVGSSGDATHRAKKRGSGPRPVRGGSESAKKTTTYDDSDALSFSSASDHLFTLPSDVDGEAIMAATMRVLEELAEITKREAAEDHTMADEITSGTAPAAQEQAQERAQEPLETRRIDDAEAGQDVVPPAEAVDDHVARGSRRGRRTPVADAGYEPGAAPSRGERVGAALRNWRGDLAETGGPNALLWYADAPEGSLDLTRAHPTGASMLMTGKSVRLSHLVREPSAFAEALRTARRIRAKATELRGQRGLDAAFVVVGMATWALPGSKREPMAPILLRSVKLHAADASESDVDLELSPTIELNPVLVHYMAAEQGVRLDPDALADLAYASGRFDPLPLYRELRRQLAGVDGFTVLDRRILSTFAPGKMAMVADLAAFSGLLAGHDVVAALAGDPVAAATLRQDGAGGLAESARRPGEPDLSREVLVLNADSAQADVIDTARSGRHVLIDAAPGTGATQTLANVAAALVGSDQRVLMICESARQLADFVAHLEGAGLGDLVLDARDPRALRATLAQATLDRIDSGDRSPFASHATDAGAGEADQLVATLRARLAAHRDCLHVPREPWGVSVFDAQTALARLSSADEAPTSRVRIGPDALRRITQTDLSRYAEQAAALARAGAWTTVADDADPWYGARVTSDADVLRALTLVTELANHRLADDRAALDAALLESGLPAGRTAADYAESFALIDGVRQILADFRPEVFTRPLADVIAATSTQADDLRWWARNGLKRDAKTLLLPQGRPESLHSGLQRAAELRESWQSRMTRDTTPHVPASYDDAALRWQTLADDLRWLEQLLPTDHTQPESGLMHQRLDDVAARVSALAARPDRAAVLPNVVAGLAALREVGMGAFVDDLAARHIPPTRVADEAQLVWWRSILDAVAEEDPAYGGHDGQAMRRLLEDHDRADQGLLDQRARAILDRARAHARIEVATRPDQVNALRDAAARPRHPRPLRELLAEIGEVVAAVRPIWVMSPAELASVVPTHLAFDAVLIDDAARMPLPMALSAIARGVRVIAAGDLAGLGPLPFDIVAGPVENDDEEHLGQVPSILTALSAFLPVRRLTRLYGDRDGRISSFVDHTQPLVALPCAGRGEALRLVRSAPLSTPTGAASADQQALAVARQRECERVVQLVLEAARREPGASLGVVTFSSEHAARLEGAIREALGIDPEVAASPVFAEGHAEPFYVASIDRAADQSRSRIVFATGVIAEVSGGMDVPGRLRRADGTQALEAIVSLARNRLDIVCPLSAADLARREGLRPGEARLAELLHHADHDGLSSPSGAERHVLVAELASRLRGEGLVVHEGYGVADTRLDLAVEDPYVPGRLVVAVTSDGERYTHAGTVRERDRLLPAALSARGWSHVRVWSTDVFRDPARDVARILDAVRDATS